MKKNELRLRTLLLTFSKYRNFSICILNRVENMGNISEEQIHAIGKVLNNESKPLKERFRALFTLRNIGGPLAINHISQCFNDPSALLKHELAYCLGQMQDENANDILISVLENEKQEPMVRHEAAEALGAIASDKAIFHLQKYKNDQVTEVAETCELALDRINWLKTIKSENNALSKSAYNSVDPAPPADSKDINNLKSVLTDEKINLFNRYRAMFALRNIGSEDAIKALGEALKCGSALFKHEVAFVLGQMQHKSSFPYLKASLEDTEENEMVRHECAEALGSIAVDECNELLEKYVNDDKRVVSESCIIALDMCEYENSPEFQYANTLHTLS